jgi:Variant SH3 domain
MSFRRGDVIDLLRRVDSNWYEGALNGKKGIIPSNYIEVIDEYKSSVALRKTLHTVREKYQADTSQAL